LPASKGLTILSDKSEDNGKKVAAVIVTLSSGGSYDRLFRTVEQKVMEGTKVEVYAADASYLGNLISAFEGRPTDEVAVRLLKSMNLVDPDCVVFNWECSGGYG
jgi:hypothetical protein